MMKRWWGAAVVAGLAVAGWVALVAARCQGSCPLCH